MKSVKETYMYILGTVIVIGFFTVLTFMIKSNEYKMEVNMIIGALIGAFITVVGYFFGSSKGSADKNEMLAKSIPNSETENN